MNKGADPSCHRVLMWVIAWTVGLTLGCRSASIPAASITAAGGLKPSQPPAALTDTSAGSTQDLGHSEPVVLRWRTASELECYGYHVYRGRSADGPFERITAQVIPGGGTGHEVRSYQFEDVAPLEPGTYYYFVEEIAMDGSSRRLTPPRPFDV